MKLSKEQREWRKKPATEDQLKALRLMASLTGRTFSSGIDRGDAWKKISRATTIVPLGVRIKCAPPWAPIRNAKG